jgi:hypothetical protein
MGGGQGEIGCPVSAGCGGWVGCTGWWLVDGTGEGRLPFALCVRACGAPSHPSIFNSRIPIPTNQPPKPRSRHTSFTIALSPPKINSPRDVEMEAFGRVLGPVGYRVVEVQADGHCLYRAVAHQVS